MPSVVHILSKQNNTFIKAPFLYRPSIRKIFFSSLKVSSNDKKPSYQSLGSGVIVADGGFVMTNYHVIKGATELEVALAGGEKNQQRLLALTPRLT